MNTTRLLQKSFDQDADGRIDTVTSYAYDNRGLLLMESVDSNNDGTPDDITNYFYKRRRLSSTQTNYGIDDFVEITSNYTYRADGGYVVDTEEYDYGEISTSQNFGSDGTLLGLYVLTEYEDRKSVV